MKLRAGHKLFFYETDIQMVSLDSVIFLTALLALISLNPAIHLVTNYCKKNIASLLLCFFRDCPFINLRLLYPASATKNKLAYPRLSVSDERSVGVRHMVIALHALTPPSRAPVIFYALLFRLFPPTENLGEAITQQINKFFDDLYLSFKAK